MQKVEIYITIIIATWFILTVTIFTCVLNLWPRKFYVKINDLQKQLKDKKEKLFKSITNDSVSLSLFLLFIGITFFILLIWLKKPDPDEFLKGIQVELFGILFDIIVLVLLFNWINKKGEKNRKIETALNEIEDFRTWHSDEAKYRIIGNIKRLNREDWSEVNLMQVKLSGTNQPRGNTDLRNINLSKSSLKI